MRRFGGWLALGLLAGCSGVHSSGDAPFAIGAIKGSAWSIGSGSPAGQGEALLVLSSSKLLGCEDFTGADLQTILATVADDGSGLVFYVQTFAKDGDPLPAWPGAYTASGAGIPSGDNTDWQGGRALEMLAFTDGMYYEAWAQPDDPWLVLDKADAKKAQGSFRSTWWSGGVSAESCPPWDASASTTTTTPYSGYTP